MTESLCTGRAAKIVEWVIRHAERINGAPAGEFVVTFGPGQIKPSVKDVYPVEDV